MKALLRGRPGSAWWLIRHELRMFWPAFGLKRSAKQVAGRGVRPFTIVLWCAGMLALHALALVITLAVNKIPAGVVGGEIAIIVTVALLVILTLMLSMTLRASVESLFERGDMDLLLSSPLRSSTIFTVRLLAIAIGSATPFLLLLTPLAHVGMFFGHAAWLSLYPVLIGMALLAASTGMLVTLGLVKLLGVRRTRVSAQVLGAVVGALMFLLGQGYNLTSHGQREAIASWAAPRMQPGASLGPDSIAWLPGRALTGSASALLALAVAGLAAFALTAAFTHRRFIAGVLGAGMTTPRSAPRAKAGTTRFRSGLTRVIVFKEWRLIARDPQLIAQVLLQGLYMLPMLAIVVRGDGPMAPALCAALTMICLTITTSLAWLVISAEDAPDLLATAPQAMRTILRAKLIAVVTPPLVLMAPALAWVGLRQPGAALLFGVIVTAGVCAAGLICLWHAKPAARDTFKTRAKGNLAQTMLEFGSSIGWSAVAFTALTAAADPAHARWYLVGMAIAVVCAMAAVGIAWMTRRHRA